MWSRWGDTWRERWVALRQLLAGGAALVAVGGAWPLLVTLTPAADRPWISGTSDNSIWSLIFGYNGLGRVAGQTGGPGGGGGGFGGGGGGGGGGNLFGGATGPFRLLESALGDQAGWLLGFAIVAGLAILVLTRLRRRDLRTGWLMAVGGAFLVTAVVFSYAGGIFHPYYVSFLAPFAAALLGAGVGLMLPRSLGGVAGDARLARVIAPLAIAAGAVTEFVGAGQPWRRALMGEARDHRGGRGRRHRPRLRAAPARPRRVWLPWSWPRCWPRPPPGRPRRSAHATSSTFPAGGSASASAGGPGGGGPGGGGIGRAGRSGRGGFGARGFGPPPGAGFAPSQAGGFAGGAGAGGPGGFGGDSSSLTAAVRYAEEHGGGAIGVSSQSSAAAAVLSTNANVAGLGGFSGRESSVSATWLAQEVAAGRLRWVIVDSSQGAALPGDTRTGSQSAMNIVASVCRRVTLSTNGTTVTMYDCQGRAAAILEAARG